MYMYNLTHTKCFNCMIRKDTSFVIIYFKTNKTKIIILTIYSKIDHLGTIVFLFIESIVWRACASEESASYEGYIPVVRLVFM